GILRIRPGAIAPAVDRLSGPLHPARGIAHSRSGTGRRSADRIGGRHHSRPGAVPGAAIGGQGVDAQGQSQRGFHVPGLLWQRAQCAGRSRRIGTPAKRDPDRLGAAGGCAWRRGQAAPPPRKRAIRRVVGRRPLLILPMHLYDARPEILLLDGCLMTRLLIAFLALAPLAACAPAYQTAPDPVPAVAPLPPVPVGGISGLEAREPDACHAKD